MKSRGLTRGAAARLRETYHLLKRCPDHRAPARGGKENGKEMPTISGDVWVHVPTGKRLIATGVTSRKYLYSPQLKEIVGKTHVSPKECRRILHNEGIVVMYNSLYHQLPYFFNQCYT